MFVNQFRPFLNELRHHANGDFRNADGLDVEPDRAGDLRQLVFRRDPVLNELLEKYAEHGTAQFVLPDALKVPPISDRGNVVEIAGMFGGPERLKEAVTQLQTLLYAA